MPRPVLQWWYGAQAYVTAVVRCPGLCYSNGVVPRPVLQRWYGAQACVTAVVRCPSFEGKQKQDCKHVAME